MKDFILDALERVQNGYSLCGVFNRRGRVYPLGSNTKVISSLFEIVARQASWLMPRARGLRRAESTKQNHYLDFTLMRDKDSVSLPFS